MRTKRDTQRDSKTERQADRDLDGFAMSFVPQSQCNRQTQTHRHI